MFQPARYAALGYVVPGMLVPHHPFQMLSKRKRHSVLLLQKIPALCKASDTPLLGHARDFVVTLMSFYAQEYEVRLLRFYPRTPSKKRK